MKYYLILIFFTLLTTVNLSAKNKGGIKFKSHNHDLESRTSLILLEESKVNASTLMVLSTDILFNKTRKHYFGYILRMIDSSHRNIDIVYNYNNPDNYNFSLIYDHEVTPIQFNFEDQNKALNEWTKLILKVDILNSEITLTVGDQSKTVKLANIQKFTNLKYYFGANNNPYFKVHDVAPITIRNINLQLDDLSLEWPLDEKNGAVVNCNQGSEYNGLVHNGIWLNELQSKWEKIDSKTIDSGLFYFNEDESYYYFIKNDTLFKKEIYGEHPTVVLAGNYPFLKHPRVRVLEKENKDILFYNLMSDDYYILGIKDLSVNKLNIQFPDKKSTTQHLSWVNDTQSGFEIFGGYGNYEYSGNMSEIDFNNQEYIKIDYKGDKISPRYFAGSGKAQKNHHYIFGGYGSKTGKQIAHPENYYDLYDYNEKTKTVKKLASWEKTNESFIVSRNIIVDTLKNQFLALTYDNHVHNNQMKLRLFDIKSKKVETIANKIPFEFNDIQTTIELKYDRDYQNVYAIVLNKVGKKTKVQIYVLDVTGGNFISTEEKVNTAEVSNNYTWVFIVLGGLVLIIIAFILRKYLTKEQENNTEKEVIEPVQHVEVKEEKQKVVEKTLPIETPLEKVEIIETVEEEEEITQVSSVINFFGGFRIIDENGNDISNKFTPLIKQIFLLISLSQFHNGRGVTIEQMTEVFWSDMPLKRARNNRSVNIAKLKQLFKLIGNITLEKTGDFWNLKFDNSVEFPLFKLKELLEKDQSKQNLEEITKILKNGKLLYGTDYPWMEEMMAQIINRIIEKLYNYLISNTISLTVKEKLKISDLILKYDALNEEAIHIKCQIYTSQGMHSMAKDTFEKFEQEYLLLYNEKFDLDYNEFLKSDLTSNQI